MTEDAPSEVPLPQLLPCPFCGQSDDLEIIESDDDIDVCVACQYCEAQGPVTRVGCRDDEEDLDLHLEAAELWNQRTLGVVR